MKRVTSRISALGIALVAVTTVFVGGCVRFSGGTWMIRSAATPEGWPELTPTDAVAIRSYPTTRAAVVTGVEGGVPAQDGGGEQGMDPMFMTLFRHIKDNDIAMTAPVAMDYGGGRDASRAASMAFLYRSTAVGATGGDGAVVVRDIEPRTFASTGVRGDYTPARFEAGLTRVTAWLDADGRTWITDGPPRYLGYNGPFVPKFMRYGEVQVPVRPRGE